LERNSKIRDYIFYNQIQTDGISCNLLFIRKDFYNKTYGEKLPEYDEDIEFEIKQLEKLTRDECEKHLSKKLIGIDPYSTHFHLYPNAVLRSPLHTLPILSHIVYLIL
jgi:hypothetical protein